MWQPLSDINSPKLQFNKRGVLLSVNQTFDYAVKKCNCYIIFNMQTKHTNKRSSSHKEDYSLNIPHTVKKIKREGEEDINDRDTLLKTEIAMTSDHAERVQNTVKKLKKKKQRKNMQKSTAREIFNNAHGDTASTDEESEQIPAIRKEIEVASDDEENKHISQKKSKKKRKKKNKDSEQKAPGEKSIRQLKREKQAHKQAQVIAEGQLQAMQEAHDYLLQWKNDRSSWKFMKAKQIWLHKHKFDTEKVTEELWPIFIEYFSSAIGNAKKNVIEDAKTVVNEMEQWIEENSKKSDNVKSSKKDDDSECDDKDADDSEERKPSELSYERARIIIQNIQE